MTGADATSRRRARIATAAVLFVLGLLLGSWAPRIPEVKSDLGLSAGQLGLGLLGAPVGAVASMWLTGTMVARYGSRSAVRVGLVLYCVPGLVLNQAVGVPSLFAVLLSWGLTAAILDIAVNAQAVEVERAYGRPVMTSMHAAWTAGALAGAGVGALGAALGVSLFWQLAVLGAVGLVTTFPTTQAMLDDNASSAADAATASPVAAAATGSSALTALAALAALSLIAVASFLGESASADWSAVYLADVTGASPGLAGIGIVAFNGVMLGARLFGDRLVHAFGPSQVVRTLAGSAAVALASALALGGTRFGTAAGVIGFAVLGGGLACVVPLAISAAGRVGRSPGTSVAIVITSGYAGWLAGPPLVGGLAELVGLHRAMAILPVLAALVAVFSTVFATVLAPTDDLAPPDGGGQPEPARVELMGPVELTGRVELTRRAGLVRPGQQPRGRTTPC